MSNARPTLPPTPPIEEIAKRIDTLATIDVDTGGIGNARSVAAACVAAARAAGWCLVPVALIEEAADAADAMEIHWMEKPLARAAWKALAAALRQAVSSKGTP